MATIHLLTLEEVLEKSRRAQPQLQRVNCLHANLLELLSAPSFTETVCRHESVFI